MFPAATWVPSRWNSIRSFKPFMEVYHMNPLAASLLRCQTMDEAEHDENEERQAGARQGEA